MYAERPEEGQARFTTQSPEELADEAAWDESFAASADELERMAAEALEDFRAGRTEEKSFDEL